MGYDGVDRRQVVDVAAFEVKEERGFLAQRTANIAVVLSRVVGGLGSGKRIGRVEGRVVADGEELPVVLVGTGLGEDFDAAVAKLVVFGGKRILVDADFANG